MKKGSLDTTNKDHLNYTHPPLDIALLGGIRLEGLDRMRVTVKVQVEHLSIRHNLDLYNDNQVEKLGTIQVNRNREQGNEEGQP